MNNDEKTRNDALVPVTKEQGLATRSSALAKRGLELLRSPYRIEFVKIPSGSFMMGSENGRDNEKPIRRVTISYEFYMGKYQVTIGEWKKIMGDIPEGMKTLDNKFKESDYQPVVEVSWYDAQEFIKKLNAKNDGYEYRLPSEAEWEYAARAGTTTEFAFGDSLSSNQANFNGDSPYGNAPKGKHLGKTTEVGSYQPNAWGLYDMHGNVWEWCQDWYGDYPSGANPTGFRVQRGGSWYNSGSVLRSAFRGSHAPLYRYNDLGFRLIKQ